MNPIFARLMQWLRCGLLTAAISLACAQSNDAPGQLAKTDSAKAAADLAAYRSTLESAKSRVKSGDAAAVEQALAPLITARADTPRWHLQTAQRLLQVAESTARSGDASHVGALASRALLHLQAVDVPTTDDSTRAAAKTLAGFVQERYLADTAGALVNYQAAVKLDPSDTQAKEASDRLQRASEAVKGKQGKK